MEQHKYGHYEGFYKVADEHFPEMVKYFTNISLEKIQAWKNYFPDFKKGHATELPFEDESVDFVFVSHILYLMNPEKAIAEMMRILKPGGILFGTQAFLSRPYTKIWTLFMKVIDGAYGYFTKKDLKNWAIKNGAEKVKFATPLSVFEIVKKNSNTKLRLQ